MATWVKSGLCKMISKSTQASSNFEIYIVTQISMGMEGLY